MILYHVSKIDYIIGKTYSINDFDGDKTYFYLKLSKKGKEVEAILKQNCPNDNVERCKTYFFFSSPDDRTHYASKQYKDRSLKVYEVEVPDAKGAYPMCLVHAIYKKIGNEALCNEIALEYWCPKKKWLFLEYLGTEMAIKKVITNKINIVPSSINYQLDSEQSQKIYK